MAEAALPASSVSVLTGMDDAYDGVLVDAASLPENKADFTESLLHSLEIWRRQGKRGIWLRVPIEKAGYLEPAVAAGFVFHHAEPTHVMCTHWLSLDVNKLPANASHQVGIGAFVLNKRREVLVVQEKNGPLRGQSVWKMPTGLVNAGEDVSEAAEREVLEETGVRAKFQAVLAIRQAHGFAFDKSDMFFCIALTPEPGQSALVPQADEIQAAAWMPLEEYAAIPFIHSRPLLQRTLGCCLAYANGTYSGLAGFKVGHGGTGARQDLLLCGEDGGGEAGG
ncbi:hypothetical protein WJX81_004616 [Elliptochloris bilobata]|uniref:Nudix hydrolase domain-containing protein n=1 Tax=Elliptochloris bilobata TaxID=381761 RepID=A0AAW1R1S9_9CHLO